MKTVNSHPLKIDVVKFDGKNIFENVKVLGDDKLTASNIEDTLRLEEKPKETSEKD